MRLLGITIHPVQKYGMNRNSSKYCLAEGCRYPEHHLTGYHRCGCCAGFGHGRYECPERHGHGSEVVSYDRINDLHAKYYTSSVRQLPVENWCKAFGCLARKYHATGSHHRLFVEDEFCDWIGPDRYGIKRMFAEADKGKDMVAHTPGYYVSYYLGHGYTNDVLVPRIGCRRVPPSYGSQNSSCIRCDHKHCAPLRHHTCYRYGSYCGGF